MVTSGSNNTITFSGMTIGSEYSCFVCTLGTVISQVTVGTLTGFTSGNFFNGGPISGSFVTPFTTSNVGFSLFAAATTASFVLTGFGGSASLTDNFVIFSEIPVAAEL